MDDKTEELRDIFMDVADEETVTESQEETRGSLVDAPGEEELEAVLEEMRDRYEFRTDLPLAELRTVVSEFYDGADDGAIAEAVGVDPGAAFRARMDLHLVTDEDLDPDFDADAARELLDEGADAGDVADALDADPGAVERFAAAVDAHHESLRANERFRLRFEEILEDAALSGRLVEDVRETGLEEATEGIETDVSF